MNKGLDPQDTIAVALPALLATDFESLNPVQEANAPSLPNIEEVGRITASLHPDNGVGLAIVVEINIMAQRDVALRDSIEPRQSIGGRDNTIVLGGDGVPRLHLARGRSRRFRLLITRRNASAHTSKEKKKSAEA
jgi:hypothetical protein